MTFQNRFQYAGLKPYENERCRAAAGGMTHHEYELLSRDDTYRKLAELRWLVSEFERELGDGDGDGDSHPTAETRAALARTVAEASVPLSEAVDYYVDRWLDAHRAARASEV
ncbi:hypothetical protein NDI76_11460 [Halogeometricum sp. S1BR25-6]|uniref:Uncharacterized protein n=1 Tax=Halogeometricum salsisoli TaxID=2950536 RepID=A0ABU2GGA2_9EURY|nr:hypothetical protein [Halogeometricum sp. S1BR25-6]MDS0299359.1 hypothetical protein [Halogeometricum sp. S1BR25-6]